MPIHRLFRVFAIGMVFALTLVPLGAATAGEGPVRVRAPFVPFTISGACSFDVRWEALADKGYYQIMLRPDGTRYILTGVLKSRFTNLQTLKSVDLANSARYYQMFNADGSATFTSNGPAVWFGVPGMAPLAYSRGRVSISYDPAGNVVNLSVAGDVEDICVTLGD